MRRQTRWDHPSPRGRGERKSRERERERKEKRSERIGLLPSEGLFTTASTTTIIRGYGSSAFPPSCTPQGGAVSHSRNISSHTTEVLFELCFCGIHATFDSRPFGKRGCRQGCSPSPFFPFFFSPFPDFCSLVIRPPPTPFLSRFSLPEAEPDQVGEGGGEALLGGQTSAHPGLVRSMRIETKTGPPCCCCCCGS